MGLSNDPADPFPHDPDEPGMTAERLRAAYRAHSVLARHGDIYDPFNYERDKGRDASSLGDAIVVELVNRFPDLVEKKLGKELPEATLRGMREIDNVRPLLLIPTWIVGLLQRTVPDAKLRGEVKAVWDGLVDDFLELPFVQERDRAWRWDAVDSLELMMKTSTFVSIATLGRKLPDLARKLRREGDTYATHALAERDYKNRRARFVVYGHTHHPEVVPLDRVVLDDAVMEQTCFNSGTWRKVWSLAQAQPDELEFLGHAVMSYIAFFTDDERAGRPFEVWNGALAV